MPKPSQLVLPDVGEFTACKTILTQHYQSVAVVTSVTQHSGIIYFSLVINTLNLCPFLVSVTLNMFIIPFISILRSKSLSGFICISYIKLSGNKNALHVIVMDSLHSVPSTNTWSQYCPIINLCSFFFFFSGPHLFHHMHPRFVLA